MIYGRRDEITHFEKFSEHEKNILHHDNQAKLYLIRLYHNKKDSIKNLEKDHQILMNDLDYLSGLVENEGLTDDITDMYGLLFEQIEKQMIVGDRKYKKIFELTAIQYLKDLTLKLKSPSENLNYYEIDKWPKDS